MISTNNANDLMLEFYMPMLECKIPSPILKIGEKKYYVKKQKDKSNNIPPFRTLEDRVSIEKPSEK